MNLSLPYSSYLPFEDDVLLFSGTAFYVVVLLAFVTFRAAASKKSDAENLNAAKARRVRQLRRNRVDGKPIARGELDEADTSKKSAVMVKLDSSERNDTPLWSLRNAAMFISNVHYSRGVIPNEEIDVYFQSSDVDDTVPFRGGGDCNVRR